MTFVCAGPMLCHRLLILPPQFSQLHWQRYPSELWCYHTATQPSNTSVHDDDA
jgi:hypothetical protein